MCHVKQREEGCRITIGEVRRQCLNCGMCSLSETGSAPVSGEGPADAEVMFIDEFPEPEDIADVRPMTGEAGKLLQCYLDVIGLSREKNIYITTLTKCRPPANRNPLKEEMDVCIQLLRKEFQVLRPKVVICAGRSVQRALIKNDFVPARECGIFYHKGKAAFVGVPRPSDLMRSPQNKATAFDYYAAIREKIDKLCEHTYEPGFLLSYDEKHRPAEKPKKQPPQYKDVEAQQMVLA